MSMSMKMNMSCVEEGVRMCALKYNFDAEECLRMIMSSMSSKSSIDNKKEVVKNKLPLPYNGEMKSDLCFGLNRNNGLYTQCSSKRKSKDEAYCNKCSKQALANEHGLPDYGNIQNRASKYEKNEVFVDPSGKSPIAFTKIMKKLKLTEEQVREEALIQGIKIDPRHFEVTSKKSGRPKQEKPEKEVKPKGRPKKSKKVLELAGEEEDLFASLVMSANAIVISENKETVIEEITTEEVAKNESSLGDVDVVVSANKKIKEKKVKEPKVVKETAEEKEQKKKELAQQKEAEKEQKKKELAEQKEQKKKEIAEQKEQKKKELALEKEQKKKEIAEEKKKPLVEKKTKETKKKVVSKVESKVESKVVSKVVSKVESKVESKVDTDDEADVVKKITFEGKKYLKSKKTGIVYNMEQDVIGKWNEEKQRIDFDEQDDKSDEESEDEYDM